MTDHRSKQDETRLEIKCMTLRDEDNCAKPSA